MASDRRAPRRPKGTIESLRSGSQRVRVYAGKDPITKRPVYLEELIPAGPDAAKLAEEARVRLVNQLIERRAPRTRATVAQMLERYLPAAELERLTRTTYEGYVRNHVLPLIGKVPIARLDADVWDPFFAELKRCRVHCTGRPGIDHRTDRAHDCDPRCRKHECRGLAARTILQIHTILSGALAEAMRWKWITVNPIDTARPPSAPASQPNPPSTADAARLLNEAWKDPEWGMFVWLTMRLGARRGEMCGLRLHRLNLDSAVVAIKRSLAQLGGEVWEKDTKTHQDRLVVLDDVDLALLETYLSRRRAAADTIGVTITKDGWLFSPSVSHDKPLKPATVSQRYRRMAERLGIKTSLKDLRSFAATELIRFGVDLRTIAGRLGHGSGGATTLKHYAAFTSEADQRAAAATAGNLPVPEDWLIRLNGTEKQTTVPEEPTEPYEKIAADLAGAIRAGFLGSGDRLPSMKELAERYHVAASTAHRAIDLLKQDGLVKASRGIQATVI